MARYTFDCDECGAEVSEQHAMGDAPTEVVCFCGGRAGRSYDVQFTQDYRRFREGKSKATGQPYAESRGEEKRMERERGITFIGRNDLTPKEKHLGEYARHVKAGGERLAPDVVNPPEKVKRKTVQQALREKGIRLG